MPIADADARGRLPRRSGWSPSGRLAQLRPFGTVVGAQRSTRGRRSGGRRDGRGMRAARTDLRLGDAASVNPDRVAHESDGLDHQPRERERLSMPRSTHPPRSSGRHRWQNAQPHGECDRPLIAGRFTPRTGGARGRGHRCSETSGGGLSDGARRPRKTGSTSIGAMPERLRGAGVQPDAAFGRFAMRFAAAQHFPPAARARTAMIRSFRAGERFAR